jgi:hypothetical protein
MATVALLCHFDGTSGSTVFNDTGGYHTLTPTSVTVSTAAPKFGTGSGDFTASSSAQIVVGGAASDFNFGAGPFTIEAWAYFTSAPSGGYQTIVSQWGASTSWWFGLDSGALFFIYSFNGSSTATISGAFTPTLNTWYHLACDRDASNVVRVYINGVVAASATVAGALFASTLPCALGFAVAGLPAIPGRLDEARITVGLAQYGGAFTPPTGPFTDNPPPITYAQVTQVGLEMWASVALAPPSMAGASVMVMA